ncbi:hypothetical protein BU16DRAFT_541884 [Lophium mytilinum]|uniref:Uncharacterized protein n=1 Tax=Lophium mytilinum TaxID=390894 RepID=A0A6A6QIM6_9PEZI|nr:hypothetical protein BU16DRAFT_541884 [Lophium mytilinum]
MENTPTSFWATYRLRSPVECCDNTHFHQLFCKHIVATPTVEPCASNCLMPAMAPQPTSERDQISTKLADEEFLCKKCVEEGGGSTHAYVLRNVSLRMQKLVMRHCFKYEEATILKLQESPMSNTRTTLLAGRILPCLHIHHGVPSPYHILECGHTVKVPPGDPASCACNCAGPNTDCDGVFECSACLATGTPIDPVHGYRTPRNCVYFSPQDITMEEMAQNFGAISVGGQSRASYAVSESHLLQCGHQIITHVLTNCCENCSARCGNIPLANTRPAGRFECNTCMYEMERALAGVETMGI